MVSHAQVAEKYLLLNREDRMKTEDARMARLRKQLDHIGLKETHIEEVCSVEYITICGRSCPLLLYRWNLSSLLNNDIK